MELRCLNVADVSPFLGGSLNNSSLLDAMSLSFKNPPKEKWRNIKVEKLNKTKDNYDLWSWAMKVELQNCVIASQLNENMSVPKNAKYFNLWNDFVMNERKPLQMSQGCWERGNRAAKFSFAQNVHKTHFLRVLKVDDAYKCWVSFKPPTTSKTATRVIATMRGMRVENEDIVSYLDKMYNNYTRLLGQGSKRYTEHNFLVDVVMGIAQVPSCRFLAEKLFDRLEEPGYTIQDLRVELDGHTEFIDFIDKDVNALAMYDKSSNNRIWSGKGNGRNNNNSNNNRNNNNNNSNNNNNNNNNKSPSSSKNWRSTCLGTVASSVMIQSM